MTTYTIESRPRGLWVYRGDAALYGWKAAGPIDAAHVLLLEVLGGRAAWVLALDLARDLELDQIPTGERFVIPEGRIRAFVELSGVVPYPTTRTPEEARS